MTGPVTDVPARRLLTPAERKVLHCIACGLTTSQTASVVGLSPSTVKAYLKRVERKLGAHDRASAVGAAFRTRLLDPSIEPPEPKL